MYIYIFVLFYSVEIGSEMFSLKMDLDFDDPNIEYYSYYQLRYEASIVITLYIHIYIIVITYYISIIIDVYNFR